MNLQLTGVLQGLKRRRMEESLACGGEGKVSGLVFHSGGRPLEINGWRGRVWKRALAKAGLPYHRIHDLRHTCATLRISKRVNIADVSAQLGHHSVKFTLEQYYHWVPGSAKREVDALDSTQPDATYTQPKKEGGVRDLA